MPNTRALFATPLYEASLGDDGGFAAFNAQLENACLMLSQEDRAGQAWCKRQGYGGYTSYASLDDLPVRDPAFGDLKKRLDRHAAQFAADLAFDLGPRGKLKLDSLWANVLKPGAGHSGHIHPHSVISGTVYVALPAGAAGLRLEDPRLAMQMAAPAPAQSDAPEAMKSFVTVTPQPGTVLMWESWLRHEVPPTAGKGPRSASASTMGGGETQPTKSSSSGRLKDGPEGPSHIGKIKAVLAVSKPGF